MVIMFNTNNIQVTKEELKILFFKKDKLLTDDDLFLDFYQFMQFALNKVCDQDFRIFMRKLKKKKNENLTKIDTNTNPNTNPKLKTYMETENKKSR